MRRWLLTSRTPDTCSTSPRPGACRTMIPRKEQRAPPGCDRSARDRPVRRGQRPAGRGDPARPLRSGSGSSRAPCSSPGLAGRRRGPRTAWAVHQFAPASIVLAAGLGAAGQKRLCAHRGIIGTVPGGRVRRAPADVEDLTARIGAGLAIGAVGTSDRGGVGQEIRHRSIARSAVAISTSHSTAWRASDTHPFEAQRSYPVNWGRSGRVPRACVATAATKRRRLLIAPAPMG